MTDQEGSTHPFDALTPDVILDAVDSAGFVTDGRLMGLNSFENRVYQVGLEDTTPVVVKFYRPQRWSDAQILEEHAFSRFLREQEMPVVAPLANDRGETLFYHAGFRFTVFPRQGGHAPELDNADHLLVLGRTLARWHAAGNDRPFQTRPAIDIIADCRAAVDYVNQGVVDPNFSGRYRDLGGALIEAMEQRLDGVTWQAINVHGDCHTGNILWRDDLPHFVDLDDSVRGPAMQDLWMLLSGDAEENSQQLRTLSKGYETFLPFPWAQRRLIEPLRARRMLRHSAWLAQRWDDPAFPLAFPWFDSPRYWQDHINDLEQELATMQRLLEY